MIKQFIALSALSFSIINPSFSAGFDGTFNKVLEQLKKKEIELQVPAQYFEARPYSKKVELLIDSVKANISSNAGYAFVAPMISMKAANNRFESQHLATAELKSVITKTSAKIISLTVSLPYALADMPEDHRAFLDLTFSFSLETQILENTKVKLNVYEMKDPYHRDVIASGELKFESLLLDSKE